nr:hypothetical protein GCM10025732_55550 [Glycomyces mayteni]
MKGFLLNEFPSGMWGAFPESEPRPAYTAAACFALIAAGVPRSELKPAAAYLRSAQRRDGHWPKEEDVWSVRKSTSDLISVSRIDTTAWCSTALLMLGGPRNGRAAARARRYLKYRT